MVGRTDKLGLGRLESHQPLEAWPALTCRCLLWQPQCAAESVGRYLHHASRTMAWTMTLDQQIPDPLLPLCASKEAIRDSGASFPIRNVNRVVGTQLGS